MHHLSALALLLASGCLSGGEGLLVPATVADDPDLPRFELSDGRLLHLQTYGDPLQPTVVMLHGGPGQDHRGYLHLPDELSDFHLVLWDQRGTGLSERAPIEELDGPTYLADLREIADAFSPDRPIHLIGHSWGGAYAAYFTQQYPDRVDHLVLVEPGALNPEAAEAGNTVAIDLTTSEFQGFLQSTDYLLPDAHAEADYFFVVALSGFDRDDAVPFLSTTFWRLGYHAQIGINTWQGNFDGSHTFDATDGIDAFTGPTLFVSGRSDGRLGHDFQMTYHAPWFADVTSFQLPDAGHGELLNRPEALAAVREFLR